MTVLRRVLPQHSMACSAFGLELTKCALHPLCCGRLRKIREPGRKIVVISQPLELSHMPLGHKQAADLATRWKQVQANWRDAHLPPAFEYLKAVVSSEEYEQYAAAFRAGDLEIRIENGFIVTCLTPKQ